MLASQFVHRRLLMLPVIGVLSSCGTPHLDPALVAKKLSDFQTAQTLTLPVADWPEDAWWQRYNDPQLAGLIGEALKNSPSLAVAQARVLQAEGVAQQQGATLLPTLEGNANVAELKQSRNEGFPLPRGFHPFGHATLDFSYEFDFWGRQHDLLQRAVSQQAAASAEAAQSKLVLATAVANSYADLAQLYGDRDAGENALHVRDETLDLVRQRLNLGLEARSAMKQVEAAAAIARGQLAEIDESIGLTEARLAALVGEGPDRGRQIHRPAVMGLKPLGMPANLAVDLIGRRPDIVAARLSAEAASLGISAAKADFYPNINLAAYFGVEAIGLNLLTKSDSEIGRAGPAIHLPIFEGGRLEGAYRTARGAYDEAIANYNQTLTQALEDIAIVATSEAALSTRTVATQDAVAAAMESRDLAVTRYKGGLGTFLEVLTAEDSLIVSQRSLADLQTRAFVLDIALVRALGGGFKAA